MVSSEAFHSGELACADHHDLTKSLDLAVEYGISSADLVELIRED